MVSERSNAQRTKGVAVAGASQRARLRNRGGARGPCGAPGNAGVQGGTGSSNLLCSSGESCKPSVPRRPFLKLIPWYLVLILEELAKIRYAFDYEPTRTSIEFYFSISWG